MHSYAYSYGEIKPDCVTDFSIHCFNSATLQALKNLGVQRATLHPELNLAQIRDIIKCIDTELVIYGKLPLMRIGNPQISAIIASDENRPRQAGKSHTTSGVVAAGKVDFQQNHYITDRTGARFFVKGDMLYNSVPIYMADKLKDIEKSGITHGRLIFTTENPEEVLGVIRDYINQGLQQAIDNKAAKFQFTRGKFYSKV